VYCQQFLKSTQWEKLMALLVFPISLSHFLLSFARLFPSPRSTNRLATYVCLSKGDYIKPCTTLERANAHRQIQLRSPGIISRKVPPHRRDLTRSLTKKRRKEQKASFCDLRCFRAFFHPRPAERSAHLWCPHGAQSF